MFIKAETNRNQSLKDIVLKNIIIVQLFILQAVSTYT